MKLSESQLEEVRSELIQEGVPVRFLVDGQNLNVITGELMAKGVNIINQLVYWNFTRPTARKVAVWLGCKAVFSQ